ncbi:hypothetical protein CEXT_307341 [Caerostris extrusa]|uniref:Uncharacterized protein n=1 Tax=Caerostris extrusa TaxID=172846 RepID=A0AAV4UVX2_CAEEX|nr:hypothetical protein CEXT_307341 [Caerostris extrusa]
MCEGNVNSALVLRTFAVCAPHLEMRIPEVGSKCHSLLIFSGFYKDSFVFSRLCADSLNCFLPFPSRKPKSPFCPILRPFITQLKSLLMDPPFSNGLIRVKGNASHEQTKKKKKKKKMPSPVHEPSQWVQRVIRPSANDSSVKQSAPRRHSFGSQAITVRGWNRRERSEFEF